MSQFEENKKRVFSDQLKQLIKGYEKANNTKLTQEEIGNKIHVSRETVSGWINCKTYPNEDARKSLCKIFNVPEYYFTKSNYEEGWTEIDEKTHDDLEKECEDTSSRIGLNKSFVAYLKSSPEIADAIIAASWVDGLMQSLSPNVPKLPDHIFQFVSSSDVKIYPSGEVLYMLRLVQRDLTEYALFLIKKWSKVIKDAHNQHDTGEEIYRGAYGWRTASGKEYTPASDRLALELIGRGSLSTGASMLVNMYNGMADEDQEDLLERAHKAYRESRSRNRRA